MDEGVVIGLVAICIVIGMGTGIKKFYEPIRIEFRVSKFNIFMQAFMMFFIITIAMAMEMSFNQWQLAFFDRTSIIQRLISQLLDSGLAVALLLPVLSCLFGKWIREFDLDVCSIYSENFIKGYYSMAAGVNCIWYLYMLGQDWLSESPDSQIILSRVIIWSLSILGTWFGIGFHCKSRIDEELEIIHKSKVVIEWKEMIEYRVPFYIAFLVNIFLLAVQASKSLIVLNIFNFCHTVIMCTLLGMLLAVITCRKIEIPSKEESNKRLIKAVGKMVDSTRMEGRYINIKYVLEIEEDKKYLVIQKRNVIWEGHEEDVSKLFEKRKIPLKEFDKDLCEEYIINLLKDQTRFIQDNLEMCRDNVIKQIRDEKIKRLTMKP